MSTEKSNLPAKSEHNRRRSVHTRRKFLVGAGVAVGLPTFESLLPKGSRAQEDRPQRLLTLYHPNGVAPSQDDSWNNRSTPNAELMSCFDPVQERMSVAMNLDGSGTRGGIQPLTTHQHMACYLSLYRSAPLASLSPSDATKTFDQFIAEDARHQGSVRDSVSINLGMQESTEHGVPPVYFNSASWKGPDQAIAPFADPRRLFEDLFGRPGDAASMDPVAEAARQALLAQKRLYIDAVLDQVNELSGQLGSEDRVRLEEFVDGVAELDRRTRELQASRAELGPMCGAMNGPVPTELYPETLDVMQDLTVRAFQCDLTRVVTFHHHCAGNSHPLYHPWLELERASEWHHLSHWDHHTDDPQRSRRDFIKVIKWHYQQMVAFVQKLQSTPGTWDNASLLDETLVCAGSSMDFGAHSNVMVRQHLFGSANGAFNEGVEADAGFDEENGTGKLWLTVLKGFGIDVDRYGTSTAILPELLT